MIKITKLFLIILTLTSIVSCDGFFLDATQHERENPNDPDYVGLDLAPAGDIEVRIGGTTYSDGSSYTFTKTLVGETETATVTIGNNSATDTLTLDMTYLTWLVGDSAFSMPESTTDTIEIPAGETKPYTLSFSPGTAAVLSGTLTIYSSDEDEGQISISLSGEGFNYQGTRLYKADLADGETILSDSYVIAGEGEIYVGNDITISSGATLTIYRDVELNTAGGYQIIVDGTLNVEGTAYKPVILSGPTTGGWGGILVNNEASIDHVFIKNLADSGGAYAIRSGDNGTNVCSGIVLTNSRIHYSGTTQAIELYYAVNEAAFNFSNNIFVNLGGDSPQEAFYTTPYFEGPISVNFSYNTIIYKADGTMATNITDDEASSYNFEYNIFSGPGTAFSDIIYSLPATYLTANYNIYDNNTAEGDFGTNVDNTDYTNTNIGISVYSNADTIFTNWTLNDFTMKQTTTYPTSVQTSITELVGSLSQVNPAGAYGNGGTPPSP